MLSNGRSWSSLAQGTACVRSPHASAATRTPITFLTQPRLTAPPPPQVALGFINIGFWILSQVPQLWENHKRKNVAGLSGAFLFGWLVADSAALLGCSLTEQEPWLIATAGYYVLSDLVSLIAPNFVPMCHEPFFRIRHLLLSLLGARWAVPLLLTPRPPTGRQVAASPR